MTFTMVGFGDLAAIDAFGRRSADKAFVGAILFGRTVSSTRPDQGRFGRIR